MRNSFKVNIGLFCAVFLWASAFVGIRVGLTDYSPGALALFRFLVASLCMGLIYHSMSMQKKIPWLDRIPLIVVGAIGIGAYNLCLNHGEQTVSAGVASFILGLMPMLTVLLSVIFLKERPAPCLYIGSVVSFTGLLLLLFSTDKATAVDYGVLIVVFAAIISALYNLLQKRYFRGHHPIAVTAWIIWGGTLSLMFFAPTLWQEIHVASISATMAATYLGIFPAALAYMAWSYVLNEIPASKASLYMYAMPVISTMLGFFILHEQPSLQSLCGSLLALAGGLYATGYWPRFSMAKKLLF